MLNSSQIVAGGGWKYTRVERIKVKAWMMLSVAILLCGVAIVGSDSFWFYASVPAGLSLVISLFLFVREKPREVSIPRQLVGGNLRNLYSASGRGAHEKEEKEGLEN